MEQIIYTTSSVDEKHLNELKVFLYSLWKNGNRYPVLLDLVNCYDNHIIMDLHAIYPNIRHITSVRIDETDEVIERAIEKIRVFDLNVMYTRPLGLKYELGLYPDAQILSIDTDIIVRGKLTGIWEGVKPGVLKVWDKGKKKTDRIRFQGGVMIYGNSPEIREYYQKVLDMVGEAREFQSVQEAIFRAWKDDRTLITKIDLPVKYNDSKLRKDSVLWHCKHSHFDKEKYQIEFQAYLKEVMDAT